MKEERSLHGNVSGVGCQLSPSYFYALGLPIPDLLFAFSLTACGGRVFCTVLKWIPRSDHTSF